MELLKQYNPLILGLDNQKKLFMAMDGLPELEDSETMQECIEIKENFNKRRDFLKSILTSTLLLQEYRKNARGFIRK